MSTHSTPERSLALAAMLDLDNPIKRAATEWANVALPAASSLQPASVVDRATLQAAGAYGLLSIAVRGHVDKQPWAVEAMLTLEGLGASEADNGVVFALACQSMAPTRAIALTANANQFERYIPSLTAGDSFGAFAMSEHESGSHPWSMTTTAEEKDDGSFVLNGGKAWVTLGPIADVVLVYAVTDRSRGAWGITCFLVDGTNPGMTRGPAIAKMGLNACPFGDVHFNDCVVGSDAVLGKVGSGASIFNRVIETERALLYAGTLGALERIIDLCVARVRTRTQGGVHLGSHQAVSHRIVEMKLAHETARLLLYKAAALIDENQTVTLAACLAKLQVSEIAVQSALDALRLFGAVGYTQDLGLEAELRDAVAGLSFSGTADMTRNAVTKILGVDRPK